MKPSSCFFVTLCSILAASFGTGCGSGSEPDSSGVEGENLEAGVNIIEWMGHSYRTVQIGNQVWMAENLRTAFFANGDGIPFGESKADWTSENRGAMGTIYELAGENLSKYGFLYNEEAVVDARGLCPTGWHIPSDAEWKELANYLGGEDVAAYAMKSAPTDSEPWNGSNTSGFSALPGGTRKDDGGYELKGYGGVWWTYPDPESLVFPRAILEDDSTLYEYTFDSTRGGFSVRCVQD